MRKILRYWIILFSFPGTAVLASDHFIFDTPCQQAYRSLTSLRLQEGLQQLAIARQADPGNLVPVFLENYADFFTLFMNEDPDDYKVMYPRIGERIDRLESGDDKDPWYRYCLSMIRVQRAAVSIKFGHLWDAAWDIRKAYQLIKDNRKRFPGFTPNQLLYGILDAVTGIIPKGYRWIASLLGMTGSLTEGTALVRQFALGKDPLAKMLAPESAFLYPYLCFYLSNQQDAAMRFIREQQLDLVNNHLLAFMAANLGINHQASAYAAAVIQHRNISDAYLHTSVWDFEMGYAELYHLQYASAAGYLERFLQNFRGKFYVKDACQKLSWCYYLMGSQSRAEEVRQWIRTRGNTDAEADKQALQEAKSGRWANPLLLRARLLSDGGYHHEAAALLQGKTEDDFTGIADKLEFAYRTARIYDALNMSDAAIRSYLITIRIGRDRKEYFAARSALQLGQLYESMGDKTKAINYYQE
ncbi:MAG TPA: hypothetical protein VG842_01095, partial [Sediminibacterium sp.]|nr:hypothetical protein [Sediminibacterium sp.]